MKRLKSKVMQSLESKVMQRLQSKVMQRQSDERTLCKDWRVTIELYAKTAE